MNFLRHPLNYLDPPELLGAALKLREAAQKLMGGLLRWTALEER